MILEHTKSRRICYSCKTIIGKGEIIGTCWLQNNFGTKKASFCKVCTIRGLNVRKKRIEHQLKEITNF